MLKLSTDACFSTSPTEHLTSGFDCVVIAERLMKWLLKMFEEATFRVTSSVAFGGVGKVSSAVLLASVVQRSAEQSE